jgi:hypothetical protein
MTQVTLQPAAPPLAQLSEIDRARARPSARQASCGDQPPGVSLQRFQWQPCMPSRAPTHQRPFVSRSGCEHQVARRMYVGGVGQRQDTCERPQMSPQCPEPVRVAMQGCNRCYSRADSAHHWLTVRIWTNVLEAVTLHSASFESVRAWDVYSIAARGVDRWRPAGSAGDAVPRGWMICGSGTRGCRDRVPKTVCGRLRTDCESESACSHNRLLCM